MPRIEPRIPLAHAPRLQLRRLDEDHLQFGTLPIHQLQPADREGIGEGRRPDIDIQAALQLRQRRAIGELPVAVAVGQQMQFAVAGLALHAQLRFPQMPALVPAQAVFQLIGWLAFLTDRPQLAVGASILQAQGFPAGGRLVPDSRPAQFLQHGSSSSRPRRRRLGRRRTTNWCERVSAARSSASSMG
ncbi:hypothetical protein D9M69_428050 [compost metagenome]